MHLPGTRGRDGDTVGCLQRRFDLGEFDPESAHLHLMVGAADELELGRPRSTGPGRRCGRSVNPVRRHRDSGRTGLRSARAVSSSHGPAGRRRSTTRRPRRPAPAAGRRRAGRPASPRRCCRQRSRQIQRSADQRTRGLGGADVVQQLGTVRAVAHAATSRCSSDTLTGSPPLTSRRSARTASGSLSTSADTRLATAGDLSHRVPFDQPRQRFGVAVLGVVGDDQRGTGRQPGQRLDAALEERHRGLGQADVVGRAPGSAAAANPAGSPSLGGCPPHPSAFRWIRT